MERNGGSESEKLFISMTRVKRLACVTMLFAIVAVASAAPLSALLRNETGEAVTNVTEWNARRNDIKNKWLSILGQLPATKCPLNPEVLDKETTETFIRKHVRYQTETNVYTDGYLLLPKQTKSKTAAIVVFHPTTPLQAKGVAGLAKEYAAEKWQGVQLVERGYIVWCPRNYINGEGADWAGNAKRVMNRHPNWTGMTQIIWDSIRAADFVQSLPQVDPDRIGCLGHSLGGKQALFAAAFDDRYKACVASEPGIGLKFSNWDALWYFGPAMKNLGSWMDNHEVLALVAPRPFLLLAGDSADSDKSLDYVNAVAPVYDLFGARSNLKFVNHHLGHRYAPQAREAAENFLDAHLKR
jgi:dienelactone hydrolase